ncbi:hypothetical protein BCR39DRAFT_516252 [Naematelia encephala]|uniref:Uncharacterized protein n=1 Tax=Naematelia encephala TaxID=71784 RepID=A0A1Y2BJT2_9TREE|nr:hypothetical protein BCR39DRAFT_516252 [Naematelia encephala]
MIVRTEPSAVTISILTAKTTGANRECEYCECPMAHSEMKSTMLEPSLFDSEEKAALRKALKDQSKQFLRTVGRLCEREVRGYQRQEKIRRLEGCYEKTKNSLQSSMKVLSSSMSPSQRRSREYDGSAAEYFKCPDKQTNLPAIPSGSPRVSAGSSAHLISEAYTSLFAKNSDNAGSWRNRLKGLHLFKKPRRSNDTDLVEPSVEISGKPNSLSEEDLGSPPSEVLTSALNFYADWNLGNAESSRAWMRAVSGEAVEIAEAEAFISEMAAMINHSRFHGRDSDAVSIASSGSSFYDPSFASSQSTLCGGQEDLRSESPDSGCTFDKGDFVPEPMLGLVSTLCEKSDMAS